MIIDEKVMKFLVKWSSMNDYLENIIDHHVKQPSRE